MNSVRMLSIVAGRQDAAFGDQLPSFFGACRATNGGVNHYLMLIAVSERRQAPQGSWWRRHSLVVLSSPFGDAQFGGPSFAYRWHPAAAIQRIATFLTAGFGTNQQRHQIRSDD